MLCVEWDYGGCICIGILNRNKTFNGDLYLYRLQLVNENLRKHLEQVNKRNVVLLINNASSHSIKNHAEENIGFKLVCSDPSTIFGRHFT